MIIGVNTEPDFTDWLGEGVCAVGWLGGCDPQSVSARSARMLTEPICGNGNAERSTLDRGLLR